ncbi:MULTISPECIES: hypothetical protein [Lysinibacillus]|uniref:hypothetical protein n=1 Tax=Lysinibacillus TaxID=400634 RepID=UPI0028A08E8F|nr:MULTISPECIES: hypothetical protein [Lysinibacillus]MEA0562424.1 hypothetical protein [Lysinibacillus irui]
MKKGILSLIVFFLIAMIMSPLTTKAKTVDQEKVEVEICLIGSDNHFVYKIPKRLHKDIPYTEMRNGIQASLASHWKIEEAHYEANNSNVAYTFYIGDLFQEKQDGQLKVSIPYRILLGMFGEQDPIQLRILASKLSHWTVNTKDWTALGFMEPFTFLSEREYIYEGAVDDLLNQRVGHFNGTIQKNQLLVYSVIYFSFIGIQLLACLILSRRLKRKIIQNPDNMHQFRKLNYLYQLLPILIIVAQIIFLVMTGLITAFGLYFSPGIDLLVIVGPILLNIILLPSFFVTAESEISRELNNKNSYHSS